MVVRKLSVSLTPELAAALELLSRQREEDRSRLVETLLREHVLVQQAIEQTRRAPPDPSGREQVGHRSRLVVRGGIRL